MTVAAAAGAASEASIESAVLKSSWQPSYSAGYRPEPPKKKVRLNPTLGESCAGGRRRGHGATAPAGGRDEVAALARRPACEGTAGAGGAGRSRRGRSGVGERWSSAEAELMRRAERQSVFFFNEKRA